MPTATRKRYSPSNYLLTQSLYSKNLDFFSFDNCNFNVQKAKETTARVVVCREFNLINSFTCECSFQGPDKGLYKDCHFTIQMLNVSPSLTKGHGKTFLLYSPRSCEP